jgi:hypothetical protein
MIHTPSPRSHRSRRGLFGFGALLTLPLAFLALSGLSAGAQTNAAPFALRIDKSVSGKLVYWFVTRSNAASEPKALDYQPGVTLSLPTPDGYQYTARLRVLDVAQGKVAHLSREGDAPKTLTANDFTYAQTVQVPVTHNGKPVQGVLVTLRYEGEEKKPVYKPYWLQPSDNGVARFSDVPLDKELTVAVTDGVQPPSSMSSNAIFDRTTSAFVLNRAVDVPKDWTGVKTVEVAAAPAAPTGAPAVPASAPPSGSSMLSNALLSVITSIVVGAIMLALLLFILIDRGILKAPAPQTAAEGPPAMPDWSKPKKSPEPIPFDVAVTGTNSGPRLVATLGAYTGSIFPLSEPFTNIGRDMANAVALTQDTAASRRHAHIQANNGQFLLVDDGSSNGTYVNGIRIASQKPKPLRPGDEVQIGTTRFRFEA